jgi:hypothetical protein
MEGSNKKRTITDANKTKRQKRAKGADVAVVRLSSREASSLIEQRTSNLIILTADASGNGKRSGLTSILRSVVPTRMAADSSSTTRTTEDEVQVVVDCLPWDENTPAEAGAILPQD